jgi:hypothetical protein
LSVRIGPANLLAVGSKLTSLQVDGIPFGLLFESGMFFELDIGDSDVRGYLIRRILDADQLSDIESLSCNTRPVADVGGMIWTDTNANGTIDGGETAVEGIIVHLLAPDGGVASSTTTAANGRYSFDGLPAGYSYSVEVPEENFLIGGALMGYGVTSDPSGSLDNIGVPDVLDGTIISSDPDLDFGYTSFTISGTVYHDLDNSQSLTGGDTGIGGVTIVLYDVAYDFCQSVATAAMNLTRDPAAIRSTKLRAKPSVPSPHALPHKYCRSSYKYRHTGYNSGSCRVHIDHSQPD